MIFFSRIYKSSINCSCKLCEGFKSKSTSDFIEEAEEVHPEYDYSKVDYLNSQTEVTVICPKHGAFDVIPSNLINLKRGCPVCSASAGEISIQNWLVNNDIKYEYQKHFKELGKQSFDFYIPSKNLLIEYNGIQHYQLVPYFHREGIKSLRYEFVRDFTKKKYAEKNGYDLLVIPYWDFKNIDSILSEKLL